MYEMYEVMASLHHLRLVYFGAVPRSNSAFQFGKHAEGSSGKDMFR